MCSDRFPLKPKEEDNSIFLSKWKPSMGQFSGGEDRSPTIQPQSRHFKVLRHNSNAWASSGWGNVGHHLWLGFTKKSTLELHPEPPQSCSLRLKDLNSPIYMTLFQGLRCFVLPNLSQNTKNSHSESDILCVQRVEMSIAFSILLSLSLSLSRSLSLSLSHSLSLALSLSLSLPPSLPPSLPVALFLSLILLPLS